MERKCIALGRLSQLAVDEKSRLVLGHGDICYAMLERIDFFTEYNSLAFLYLKYRGGGYWILRAAVTRICLTRLQLLILVTIIRDRS